MIRNSPGVLIALSGLAFAASEIEFVGIDPARQDDPPEPYIEIASRNVAAESRRLIADKATSRRR